MTSCFHGEVGFFCDGAEAPKHRAPDRVISITRSAQGRRKQYGLRHRVAGTIHSAMGDTFESMATSISLTNSSFGLCDKGQQVVIISRARDPRRTIFVGNKNDTARFPHHQQRNSTHPQFVSLPRFPLQMRPSPRSAQHRELLLLSAR